MRYVLFVLLLVVTCLLVVLPVARAVDGKGVALQMVVLSALAGAGTTWFFDQLGDK